jgi:ribA/ribD-fused uncharacterized protein
MIEMFRGEYRWLSNFTPVSVLLDGILDGITYPSVEHAYQAAKTLDPDQRKWFSTCSPVDAKHLGKRVKLRDDWLNVRIEIMRDLCTQKYSQEPFKSQLIATGDQEIQEGNYWGDTFWGVDLRKRIGLNHLGRIIMQIREHLRSKYDT